MEFPKVDKGFKERMRFGDFFVSNIYNIHPTNPLTAQVFLVKDGDMWMVDYLNGHPCQSQWIEDLYLRSLDNDDDDDDDD